MKLICWMLLVSLFLGLSLTAIAQDVVVSPEAAFVAYHCTFIKETNSVQINAVLMGSDGLPIPRESYTVTVASGGQFLPIDRYRADIVVNRPPLQMILVLDITDTVPVTQIVNAVRNHLMPQLNPLDEVALITFSHEISPPTQFYTDKNRLMNEHMLDMLTLEGENRLYNAILRAIDEMPFNSDKRQIVLLLTDSNRRDTDQPTADVIINEALADKIQIFSIGFFTRDRPDITDLRLIGNGTNGYTWIYDEVQNSRASIEAAVSDFLKDFHRAVNSEIAITVDVQGLTPDTNDRIIFDLVVDAENEIALSDQISCQVQRLQHSITFIEGITGTTVTGPVDIGVRVESDLSPENWSVVFRVNDEIVQNSPEQIYTFNAPALQPGYYNIGAQLVDRNSEVLASTGTTIRLFVQQQLQINMVGDPVSNNPVRFEVVTNPEFELPPAQFTIRSEQNPSLSAQLGDGPIAFQAGRAEVMIEDFPTYVRELFPNISEEDRLRISVSVPGLAAGEPDLAISNVVTVNAPPLPPQPQPAISLREVKLQFNIGVPIGMTVALLVLNFLLFRWVGYARIRRIIRNEDDYELGPQLMAVTVYREGVRQTHPLTKKTVYVGRGKSGNDINLGDNASISRQHGVFMWRKQSWYYSNRKRLARTRIDGKWRRGYILHKLDSITELEIGNALLVFHSSNQQDITDHIKTNF